MKRRGFLGLLGGAVAAPFVINATRIADTDPVVGSGPASNFPRFVTQDGKTYQMIRAHVDLKAGDVVCFSPHVFAGVAAGNIDKGNYGMMQVAGPATVRMR